jgi:hypothetical protein
MFRSSEPVPPPFAGFASALGCSFSVPLTISSPSGLSPSVLADRALPRGVVFVVAIIFFPFDVEFQKR